MDDSLLRINQIVGQAEVTPEQAADNRRTGKSPRTARPFISPLIPVGRSSFWKGVAEGRYPQPVKLGGGRTTCWRKSEIMALIEDRGH
ncbi:AlpA family phage regulatory protein [bacterium]|nr:AlpA family phage regulatory protein [bacterium]